MKTLVYEGKDGLVALLVRGDQQLNEIKASRLPQVQSPLSQASEAQVRSAFGAGFGSLGPHRGQGTGARVFVAITSVRGLDGFRRAARTRTDKHYIGVNWGRDLPEPANVADIRNVVEGDASPTGSGRLKIVRGIEVGHVFQLGRKYSEAMKRTVLDERAASVTP